MSSQVENIHLHRQIYVNVLRSVVMHVDSRDYLF